MIRLTMAGKIVYQMLGQIVLLLMLYAMLFLLSATQALPYFTIAHLLPSNLIAPLVDRILHLVILTGIITAGVVMCSVDNRYLLRLHHAWTGLIITTLLFSGSDIMPLLDILTALLLFGYLGLSQWNQPPTPFLSIWRVGIMLIIVCILAQWVVTDRWLAVILLFRVHVAYSVTGISIMFWLMTRWSNVRAEWAREGVTIVSGFVACAGLLTSIAPLVLSPFIGILSAFVVPVCYMILAGHSYRALRDRNQNLSLSPHWIAIAVLLWLAGGGFLGTLSTQFGIQQWLQGTRLAEAQHWLMIWGMLAINLSLVNNTATQLRGENRRVTGYMPLWLIAFGNGFGGIVLGCAGVVEIYLLRFLTIDRVTVETLLIPLSIVWIVCLLIVAIGIAIYALGFWIRRPTIIVH
jgi:hypothetical protein